MVVEPKAEVDSDVAFAAEPKADVVSGEAFAGEPKAVVPPCAKAAKPPPVLLLVEPNAD